MENTELAYLAGIIDGEGYINIQWVESSHSFYLQLTITNSNLELIDWIRERIIGCYFHRREAGYSTNTVPVFTLQLNGKKTQSLLKQLLPFLIVKRAKATIALEFPIGRSGSFEKRKECYLKLRAIK